jgi:hypothetical protein
VKWFLLLLVSCEGVPPVRVVPHVKPPTELVLNAPLADVRLCAIKSDVGRAYNSRGTTVALQTYQSHDRELAAKVFAQPEGREDIVIEQTGLPVGQSDIYCARGQLLDYVVSFDIRFAAEDEGRTRVRVIALEPKVLIPVSSEFSRYNRVEHPVTSSGFEEYAILRTLASCLGESLPQPEFPSRADVETACGPS